MPEWGERAAALTLPAAGILFLVLAVLETHRPRQAAAIEGRWATNAALFALVLGAAVFAAPQRAVGMALEGWESGFLAWLQQAGGPWAALAAGLVLLDGLAYALHRLMHLRPFWRLHAVHHADRHMDATTALRHHPGEYLVNAALGGAVMVLCGLPAWVAAIHGLLIMLSDLWTHANVALPQRLERALSTVFVTPGWHRVHHSADPQHFGTNYGSILSV